MFGKVKNGWKADNIDLKIFSPESLKYPPFFSKKVPFFIFSPDRLALTKKVTILHKCRKLIFLLFSSSRVDLFVKKQNCRNLSLISHALFFEPPLSPYKPNVMNDKYLLVTFPANTQQLRFMWASYWFLRAIETTALRSVFTGKWPNYISG